MRAKSLALILTLVISSLTLTAHATSLLRLRTEGSRMVTTSGKPVTLRGCNLGSWLLIEAWMLGWEIEDQETIIQVLTDRFGKSMADRLITSYRDGFITQRDFELIKSFGFNLVRLPFDSRMLIDEKGVLKPGAFKYLDRGLEMAEKAGVYVVLDMHGAPGSQSGMDHTGKRDLNKLWSDAKLQNQMVELWRTISKRYKNRSVIAAYDILNEPYGDYRTDMRPALRTLIPRCYRAIRSTGDSTVVIFPNALGAGITFYGDLKSQGFKQIAFTDHYYPGLFGSPSTLQSHAGVFVRTMPEAQEYLKLNNAAMLIGEFNVVLEKAGGDAVMRRYFDDFAKRGWMATMWSYKLLKPAAGVQPDNWYLVTNKDALPELDLKKSSLKEIESYFGKLGTMPLVADEELRLTLTSPRPPSIHLPELLPLPTSAPKDRGFKDWSLLDVDTAKKSGLVTTDQSVSIVATGSDVFGRSDSFAFLQQKAPTKAVLTSSVNSLLESGPWAKAGLMVRFGIPKSKAYQSAPFAMVNAFSDGTVAFLFREAQGDLAKESKRFIGPLPFRIAIARDAHRVEAYVESAPDIWIKLGSATIRSSHAAQIGLVAASNSRTLFTRAGFSSVTLSRSNRPAGKLAETAQASIQSKGSNLLKDPFFKMFSTGQFAWNQWGNAISSRPGLNGVTVKPGAGLWQDISVAPGKTYAFAIRVRRTPERPAMNLTLSLEATSGNKLFAITDQILSTAGIESKDGWSVLRVKAVAPFPIMRILIRTGSIEGAEQASVEIEEARFWQEG